MAVDSLNAHSLVAEYKTLVLESRASTDGAIDWNKLHFKLVNTAEWTDEGASHVLDLARRYGSFVLRNALAIAVAAEIEDGELML